jgi:hypothetical protein
MVWIPSASDGRCGKTGGRQSTVTALAWTSATLLALSGCFGGRADTPPPAAVLEPALAASPVQSTATPAESKAAPSPAKAAANAPGSGASTLPTQNERGRVISVSTANGRSLVTLEGGPLLTPGALVRIINRAGEVVGSALVTDLSGERQSRALVVGTTRPDRPIQPGDTISAVTEDLPASAPAAEAATPAAPGATPATSATMAVASGATPTATMPVSAPEGVPSAEATAAPTSREKPSAGDGTRPYPPAKMAPAYLFPAAVVQPTAAPTPPALDDASKVVAPSWLLAAPNALAGWPGPLSSTSATTATVPAPPTASPVEADSHATTAAATPAAPVPPIAPADQTASSATAATITSPVAHAPATEATTQAATHPVAPSASSTATASAPTSASSQAAGHGASETSAPAPDAHAAAPVVASGSASRATVVTGATQDQDERLLRIMAEREYFDLSARVLRLPASTPEILALQSWLRQELLRRQDTLVLAEHETNANQMESAAVDTHGQLDHAHHAPPAAPGATAHASPAKPPSDHGTSKKNGETTPTAVPAPSAVKPPEPSGAHHGGH